MNEKAIDINSKKARKARQAQMPVFNWLFVMIIGAIILFFAIFFAAKLLGLGGYQHSAEMSREFDILLNPFVSIGSMAKSLTLSDNVVAEISCNYSQGKLGKQGIRTKSQGSFGKWTEFTPYSYIYDKYIFADKLEGKIFYIFSKPFEMPFKIDELIYVIDTDYCFVNAPADISSEIADIQLETVKNADASGSCDEGSKKVCFENENDCNIKVTCSPEDVECNTGSVAKDSKKSYFASRALMYAAVFASHENYNCNFARLMERLEGLCNIYKEKAEKLGIGCNTAGLSSSLETLKNTASAPSLKIASQSKQQLYLKAEALKEANLMAECPVF